MDKDSPADMSRSLPRRARTRHRRTLPARGHRDPRGARPSRRERRYERHSSCAASRSEWTASKPDVERVLARYSVEAGSSVNGSSVQFLDVLRLEVIIFQRQFQRWRPRSRRILSIEREDVMNLDQDKLNAFLGRAVVDIGATLHAGLVVIGEKLGLYKALADAEEPLSPAELAQRTETTERYVREWLNAQAAGGYVTYHADSGRYSLTPEQAFAL